jgi:Ca2+-binding RTX toxin-like protein
MPPDFPDDVDDGSFDNVLTGTTGNDFIRGTALSDHIIGLEGDDQLWGNNGDDTLEGGAGNDTLVGGHGFDTLIGGDGDDIYLIHYAPDAIFDSSGNDEVRAAINLDLSLYPDIERFYFSATHTITVTGTSGDDLITMVNYNAPGVARAGAGNDTLTGAGSGSDIFEGGLGRDVMDGGARNYGGPYYGEYVGPDRFDFRTVADSAVGTERDVILNFTHDDGTDANSDLIHLGLIDANTTRTGNQAFTFIADAGFSGTAGELRVTPLEGTTDRQIVSGDVDGDGLADFEIEVQMEFAAPLTAADFIL